MNNKKQALKNYSHNKKIAYILGKVSQDTLGIGGFNYEGTRFAGKRRVLGKVSQNTLGIGGVRYEGNGRQWY